MFTGRDDENKRMEIVELEGHSYYVATQFHPEYLSRPLKPSPPFLGLILASVGKLKYFLARGCKFSPRQLSDNESGIKSNIYIKKIMYVMYVFCSFLLCTQITTTNICVDCCR